MDPAIVQSIIDALGIGSAQAPTMIPGTGLPFEATKGYQNPLPTAPTPGAGGQLANILGTLTPGGTGVVAGNPVTGNQPPPSPMQQGFPGTTSYDPQIIQSILAAARLPVPGGSRF